MSCMDNYRVNNIPVVPLQQMGGTSYPYGSFGNQMMQNQMTQVPQMTQAPNIPQMPMMPQDTQMPQTPQMLQGMQMPMQDMPPSAMPLGVMDIEFTQGYLRSQIGSRVKVEFLIGTNMLVDREGLLVDVGVSYIIINETETDDLLLCDIYSIKFVRFYR
ncbi:MAG: hypothetical protein ACOX89_08850 [Lutispora sp.]|jgi:hypothetical protein|uniref:hypothetical protein n=1 Tax=Lutispora sp. TaxID=2828727 RepID=UPI00356151E8